MKDFVFRYSAIDCSYRCLKKFELQYVQGLKSGDDSADLHFGTTLHSALSAILQQDDTLGPVDPQSLFDQQWGGVKRKEVQYSRGNWDEFNNHGKAFIDKFLRLHAKKYQPIAVEKEMQFNVGPYRFSGTVDFIGHVDGTVSVVDWKTSAYPYNKGKIEVSPQMYLYAHAVKQVMGLDVEQLIYVVFVKNPDRRIQTLKFNLTQAKLDDMLESVKRQCDLITQTKVLPKNHASCIIGDRCCEFFNHCYSGGNNNG